MSDLKPPIQYMEISDFTPNGDVDPSLDREPLFVMIQTSYCGHCRTSKPDFQRLADSRIVNCMTIQADGRYKGEAELARILDRVYPDFKGFPSYMLFFRGRKIPYEGGRDYQSMKEFITRTVKSDPSRFAARY